MNKALPLPLLFLLFSAANAESQDSATHLTYQISAPTRGTKEFIDKTSFRGVAFDYRQFVGNGHVSVGAGVGWNILDSGALSETTSIDTEDLDGDITGTQFRYVNAFPVMGQVFYHFGNPERTHAYAGTGAGMYYIRQRFEVGLLAVERSNWHFGFAPEAGVNLAMSGGTRLNLAVRYNCAIPAGTDVQGDKSGYDYLSFNIGVAFFGGVY